MFSCESFAFGVVESLKAGTAGGFGVGCDCKGHAVILFLSRRENRGRVQTAPDDAASGLARKGRPLPAFPRTSRIAFHKFCPWSTGDPVAGYVTCSFPNDLRDHGLNQAVLPLCEWEQKQRDISAFLD